MFNWKDNVKDWTVINYVYKLYDIANHHKAKEDLYNRMVKLNLINIDGTPTKMALDHHIIGTTKTIKHPVTPDNVNSMFITADVKMTKEAYKSLLISRINNKLATFKKLTKDKSSIESKLTPSQLKVFKYNYKTIKRLVPTLKSTRYALINVAPALWNTTTLINLVGLSYGLYRVISKKMPDNRYSSLLKSHYDYCCRLLIKAYHKIGINTDDALESIDKINRGTDMDINNHIYF